MPARYYVIPRAVTLLNQRRRFSLYNISRETEDLKTSTAIGRKQQPSRAMATETPAAPADHRFKKEAPFWREHIGTLADPARKLLEEYSGIAADKVIQHVEDVRDQAWEIFPYPCIGMYRFLDLSLINSQTYPEILTRLKSGQRYLELGSCFGQEIRQLVSDGVPSAELYASDLRVEFWDLGYALFLDKDRLKSTFIEADVFDADSALAQLDGTVDIIHSASFFHLFDYEKQVEVAKRVVKLLRPVPGSLLVGRQVGSASPRAVKHPRGEVFRHDEQSWKGLWDRVGEELGVGFEVEARLEETREQVARTEEVEEGKEWQVAPSRLRFAVRRL